MACTSFDNLFTGQDSVMYQNSYQGEGNPLTAGIYSLLIPTSDEEIQQVGCNDASKQNNVIRLCISLLKRSLKPAFTLCA